MFDTQWESLSTKDPEPFCVLYSVSWVMTVPSLNDRPFIFKGNPGWKHDQGAIGHKVSKINNFPPWNSPRIPPNGQNSKVFGTSLFL